MASPDSLQPHRAYPKTAGDCPPFAKSAEQNGDCPLCPGSFRIGSHPAMSLEGQFLVASRELLDPSFARSVVLLVQHSEEGAMGLVVNRPTKTTLAEAWKQVSEAPCPMNGLIYLGGP